MFLFKIKWNYCSIKHIKLSCKLVIAVLLVLLLLAVAPVVVLVSVVAFATELVLVAKLLHQWCCTAGMSTKKSYQMDLETEER